MITFLRELTPHVEIKTSTQALLRKEKSAGIKVEIGIISPLDCTAKLTVQGDLLVQHNVWGNRESFDLILHSCIPEQ